jgi:hypothetical protein
VTVDAADYQVQPDQNAFFMYNPFDRVVIEQVLERIELSLLREARPIWLIYHAFNSKYKFDERTGASKYGTCDTATHGLQFSSTRERSTSQAKRW